MTPADTEAPLAWPQRWANRALRHAGFRRWALKIPGVRCLARRRADELFGLVGGFVLSQVLSACVRLDVFRRLEDQPASAGALAREWRMPEARARVLLDAACDLELLTRTGDGGYALGHHGASLLAEPGLAAMVAHHEALYRDLTDPLALLRDPKFDGELRRFWAYVDAETATLPDGAAADYSRLMDASQGMLSGLILDAYPFGRHRSVCDVGGGDGGFVRALAQRHPSLSLGLFDLPSVGERASTRLAADGLADRVTIHGGSFFDDPLPPGYDALTLVRILHDHDDDAARRLLAAVHAALPPGGRLVVAEPMAGQSAAGARVSAYFRIYLAAMGSGRPRTPEMISEMLREAGFERVRHRRTALPMVCSLVMGSRVDTQA